MTLDEHLGSLLFRVSDPGGLVCYGPIGSSAGGRAVWIMTLVLRLGLEPGWGDACVAADHLGLVAEPDRVETRGNRSVGDTGGIKEILGT